MQVNLKKFLVPPSAPRRTKFASYVPCSTRLFLLPVSDVNMTILAFCAGATLRQGLVRAEELRLVVPRLFRCLFHSVCF